MMAEGARDKHGNYIGSSYVQKVLEESLGEEVRITMLGHVQRGGKPSAFDRNLGTEMGHAAVMNLLTAKPDAEPQMIGIRGNRITSSPLMHCVEQTHAVADAIEKHDYERRWICAQQFQGNLSHSAHLCTRPAPRTRTRPETLSPGSDELRRSRTRHEYCRPRCNAPGDR